MQQPTCTNLKIRSSRDAHKIFYAVRRGVLQLVTRRLDTEERQALRSGCVYAWEERGPSTEVTGLGIERFTEGRRWSPSRVRDEFLFYYEKWTAPTVELGQPGGSDQRGEPPADWHPLVKQTYSVYIETDKGRRKWHLTAYFTQPTVDGLGTIDELPDVVNVEVPEGMFSSTRATTRVPRSSRTDGESRSGTALRTAGQNPTIRTYAAYPIYEPDVPYIQAQQTPQPQPADSRTQGYPVRSPTDLSYEAQYTAGNSYNQRTRWYTPTPVSPASGAWHGSPSPSMANPISSTRAYGASSRSTLAYEQPQPAADTTVTRHALAFSLSSTHDSTRTRPIQPREIPDSPYNHFEHPSNPRSSLRHRPSSWSEPTLALHNRPEPISISRSGGTHSEGSGGSSPRSPQSDGGRVERDSSPALVPLRSLLRNHPYRRDPMDDRLLRKLDPRTSTA